MAHLMMERKMYIDIDDECVPKIVEASLKESYHILGMYLEMYKKKDEQVTAIFVRNKKEDVKQIKEMRKAIEHTLKWYTTGEYDE